MRGGGLGRNALRIQRDSRIFPLEKTNNNRRWANKYNKSRLKMRMGHRRYVHVQQSVYSLAGPMQSFFLGDVASNSITFGIWID